MSAAQAVDATVSPGLKSATKPKKKRSSILKISRMKPDEQDSFCGEVELDPNNRRSQTGTRRISFAEKHEIKHFLTDAALEEGSSEEKASESTTSELPSASELCQPLDVSSVSSKKYQKRKSESPFSSKLSKDGTKYPVTRLAFDEYMTTQYSIKNSEDYRTMYNTAFNKYAAIHVPEVIEQSYHLDTSIIFDGSDAEMEETLTVEGTDIPEDTTKNTVAEMSITKCLPHNRKSSSGHDVTIYFNKENNCSLMEVTQCLEVDSCEEKSEAFSQVSVIASDGHEVNTACAIKNCNVRVDKVDEFCGTYDNDESTTESAVEAEPELSRNNRTPEKSNMSFTQCFAHEMLHSTRTSTEKDMMEGTHFDGSEFSLCTSLISTEENLAAVNGSQHPRPEMTRSKISDNSTYLWNSTNMNYQNNAEQHESNNTKFTSQISMTECITQTKLSSTECVNTTVYFDEEDSMEIEKIVSSELANNEVDMEISFCTSQSDTEKLDDEIDQSVRYEAERCRSTLVPQISNVLAQGKESCSVEHGNFYDSNSAISGTLMQEASSVNRNENRQLSPVNENYLPQNGSVLQNMVMKAKLHDSDAVLRNQTNIADVSLNEICPSNLNVDKSLVSIPLPVPEIVLQEDELAKPVLILERATFNVTDVPCKTSVINKKDNTCNFKAHHKEQQSAKFACCSSFKNDEREELSPTSQKKSASVNLNRSVEDSNQVPVNLVPTKMCVQFSPSDNAGNKTENTTLVSNSDKKNRILSLPHLIQSAKVLSGIKLSKNSLAKSRQKLNNNQGSFLQNCSQMTEANNSSITSSDISHASNLLESKVTDVTKTLNFTINNDISASELRKGSSKQKERKLDSTKSSIAESNKNPNISRKLDTRSENYKKYAGTNVSIPTLFQENFRSLGFEKNHGKKECSSMETCGRNANKSYSNVTCDDIAQSENRAISLEVKETVESMIETVISLEGNVPEASISSFVTTNSENNKMDTVGAIQDVLDPSESRRNVLNASSDALAIENSESEKIDIGNMLDALKAIRDMPCASEDAKVITNSENEKMDTTEGIMDKSGELESANLENEEMETAETIPNGKGYISGVSENSPLIPNSDTAQMIRNVQGNTSDALGDLMNNIVSDDSDLNEATSFSESDDLDSLYKPLEVYLGNPSLWKAKEFTTDRAEFSFLWHTLILTINLGKTVDINKQQGVLCKTIEKISFKPDFSVQKSNCVVLLLHQVILQKINVQNILKKYPTSVNLPQILDEVSSSVERALWLQEDIMRVELGHLTCFRQVTSYRVMFVNLGLHVRLVVTFQINPKTYPHGVIQPKFEVLLGSLGERETEINDEMEKVKPGKNYLWRMAKVVDNLLHKSEAKLRA